MANAVPGADVYTVGWQDEAGNTHANRVQVIPGYSTFEDIRRIIAVSTYGDQRLSWSIRVLTVSFVGTEPGEEDILRADNGRTVIWAGD